jgi:hypothetical protein
MWSKAIKQTLRNRLAPLRLLNLSQLQAAPSFAMTINHLIREKNMLQQTAFSTVVDSNANCNVELLDALTAVELESIAGGAVICNDH